MARTLKVGVVGLGKMGSNHARVLDTLKDVQLVGVYDADFQKAHGAALKYGCQVFESLDDMVTAGVDAVCIATTTSSHREVGVYFLERGISCLIEKPLATTREDCQFLIECAKENNAKLMVGHIERFNPAVKQLIAMLAGKHSIRAIDAKRMSFSSSRISDVDVVLDLMVHDIDIVLALLDYSDIKNVKANSFSKMQMGDYVNAILKFDTGAVANITASRVTQSKIRNLTVTTDKAYITLDYILQEIYLHRQNVEPEQTADGSYIFDLQSERVVVRNAEPLAEEIKHFVTCVKDDISPLVGGAEALATLEVVWKIAESACN